MKRSAILGAVAAGAAAFTYTAYRKEMHAARQRILIGRRVVDSPHGPIEFAESGVGRPVFVVHGAGGGFDQGIAAGRGFLGDGYRIIAPSRFGYLGTPLPRDASPQAQADAHARVLDTLHLDRVPVIGVSAGAPSAMQLVIRHPDRCSALVLIVPLAYAPDAPLRRLAPAVQLVFLSDFVYWAAVRVARAALVQRILGVPADVLRTAPAETRRALDQVLNDMLPISRRIDGLANEGTVASNLTRFALEEIRVPTLVFSAKDDGYRTYAGAKYTAEQTRGQFVGYATGGHFLVGHEDDFRKQIVEFLSD